jgi:hypothetical protein
MHRIVKAMVARVSGNAQNSEGHSGQGFRLCTE